MATTLTTPIGRLVQGSLHNGSTTNLKGEPLFYKTGANKGQPRTEWFFALAIEKHNPELPAFLAALAAVAVQAFPQFFPQGAAGQCLHPRFSWKYKDGDGVDDNGKQNATKEGWKGCYVFSFKGSQPPQAYHNGVPKDPKTIRCGDFVRVLCSTEGNGGGGTAADAKPGIYLNHIGVEFQGYGQEIIGGPDVREQFAKTQAAYRPAGMSDVPLGAVPAGATPAPPGYTPAPGLSPAYAPPMATPPPAYAPPVAAAPPAYTPPVAVAPPPAYAPPPVAAPAPVARQMTAKANGATYEQFMQPGSGWTDDLLIAQGYMLPISAPAAAFAYPGAAR